VLLPGLLAAGIGSLVFIGLGSLSGLSMRAWALSPFPLQHFTDPGWGDFGWTIALALVTAVVVFAIMKIARWAKVLVNTHSFTLTILAGLAVGGLAIAYAEATGQSPDAVLFSGETAFGTLFSSAATVSLSTLALLIVCKGHAWSISLGNFRGGPTSRRSSSAPLAPRARRGRMRFDPAATAVLHDDRPPPLAQGRTRHRPPRCRGSRRRLPDERSPHRLR
jgi:hypothetical protein